MDIDLQLFKNIMAESRHNSDLLDSFSPNQFKSKERIIKHIRDQLILRTDSEIVILGGWYGSILIPAFKEVKRITLIDKDEKVISIAKNTKQHDFFFLMKFLMYRTHQSHFFLLRDLHL